MKYEFFQDGNDLCTCLYDDSDGRRRDIETLVNGPGPDIERDAKTGTIKNSFNKKKWFQASLAEIVLKLDAEKPKPRTPHGGGTISSGP